MSSAASDRYTELHSEMSEMTDIAEPIQQLPDNILTDDTFGDFLKRAAKTSLLTAEEEVDLAQQIEAGVFATRLLNSDNPQERSRYNFASDEELHDLAELGEAARTHFTEANLRLVVKVARSYIHPGASLSDLVQIGNVGLVDAVTRFDYTLGYKFSTYAEWWIHKELKAHAANLTRSMRLPKGVIGEVREYRRTKRELEDQEADTSNEIIAEKMGKTEEQVRILARAAMPLISLDSGTNSETDSTFGDAFEDINEATPDKFAEFSDLRDKLERNLSMLDKKESALLRMYFGFDGSRRRTLYEIGELLDIPRTMVNYVKRKALNNLRGISDDLAPYLTQE